MGGQVVGGGVIVVVAVALWLVYLVPAWHGRHQYDATERDAVRLGRTLRALAETSQAPQEVQVELDVRGAADAQRVLRREQAAQQKTQRRAQAERERLTRKARAQRDRLITAALVERERERTLVRDAELERVRARRAAAARTPWARRSRARRRARLCVTVLAAAGLAAAGAGGWLWAAGGSTLPLWTGAAVVAVCAVLLVRMATVRRRAAAHARDAAVTSVPASAADASARVRSGVPELHMPDSRAWTPRPLPRPLTASAGSQASATVDAEDAREQLRQAAWDEPLRDRAAREAPVRLDTVRPVASDDDARIEQHVRELLRRRVAG